MTPRERRWVIWAKTGLIVVIIVALLVAHFRFDLFTFLDPESIGLFLDSVGPAAPVVFIPAMALAVVVSPIPGIPLAVSAGMIFGPFLGGIYSLLGGYAGAALSFLLARYFGRDVIERTTRTEIRFYPDDKTDFLAKIIFVSRLIPFISFDVVSYGAGFTRISFLKYTIATILGMIPFTFVYTYFGSLLFVRPWITIVAGVLFLVAFLAFPVLVKRYNLFGLRDLWFQS